MEDMFLLILMCKVDALLKALDIEPDSVVPRGHYALYRDGKLEHNEPARPNSYLDCFERLIHGKYSPWDYSEHTYTIEPHEDPYSGGQLRKKKTPEPAKATEKPEGEKDKI